MLVAPDLDASVDDGGTARTEPRLAEVVSFESDRRAIELAAGGETLLIVNENANDGWVARIAGSELESVRVDGWRQGYVVPAGAAATVELSFEAITPYRIGLVVGVALVVLLIGLALWRVPDRGERSLAERPWPSALAAGSVLFVAVWIGGVVGLVALGVALAIRRVRPGLTVPAIVMTMGIAAAWVALTGGTLPDREGGSFGRPVQTLTVFAIVAALTATWNPSSRKSS
jgi:arabinofuranan 3-O-arabinosyltransferase